MAVRPDSHGCGVGRRLVETAGAFMSGSVEYLQVKTPCPSDPDEGRGRADAGVFYEAMGFVLARRVARALGVESVSPPGEEAVVTVAPARAAAYEVVRRVFEEDAYADRALRTASAGLDDRDRALARQLAFGTVQRMRTLDHVIETLGKRPVRKLDAPVLAALRLGAFQLGFLGGVPRYAAVNESVELVRRAGLERAVPFANAVLRRVGDGIERLLADLPEGPLKHSYPDWVWDALAARPRRGSARSRDAEPRTSRRRRSCGSCAARSRASRQRGAWARASRRRGGARRRADLAPEPRVAARRPRRRRPAG